MKTVIIGANGVIGNALFTAVSALYPDCIGLTAKQAPSLTTVRYDAPSLQPFLADAETVIYCVGMSKFSECERYPEQSLFLNAGLPQAILARLSPEQSFVYFSSPIALYDFGSKTPYRYALHKQMAETMIGESGHAPSFIIRPSKIIESAGIVKEWKQRLQAQEKIVAFSDQHLSPISAAIIAEQVIRLVSGRHRGAYNFSARDRLSYFDLAMALCRHFGLETDLVAAGSAQRDNHFFFSQDVLDCAAAERTIGYVPPAANDILTDYFRKLA